MDSTYADWETTQGIASWLKVPRIEPETHRNGPEAHSRTSSQSRSTVLRKTPMMKSYLLPILPIRQTARTRMVFSARKLLKQSVLVIRHGSLLIASRLALREQIKRAWSIMASLKTSNRGTSFSQGYLITSGFFGSSAGSFSFSFVLKAYFNACIFHFGNSGLFSSILLSGGWFQLHFFHNFSWVQCHPECILDLTQALAFFRSRILLCTTASSSALACRCSSRMRKPMISVAGGPGTSWERRICFPVALATMAESSDHCRSTDSFCVAHVFGMYRHLQDHGVRLKVEAVRYISDSSYWLYLMHIPLVMVLACLIQTWRLPVFVKLCIICFGATLHFAHHVSTLCSAHVDRPYAPRLSEERGCSKPRTP